MFENPSSGGLYVEPGRYIVKVVKLDPMPASPQFPEAGPGIKWIFNLQDAATKVVVQDDRGFPGEFWQFSSAKMTPNAKARKWAGALLGRAIDNNDTGESLAIEVLGKKALALIGENDKGRTAILSLSPIAPANGAAVKAAPAPKPEPVAVGAAASADPGPLSDSDAEAIAAKVDAAPDDEF